MRFINTLLSTGKTTTRLALHLALKRSLKYTYCTRPFFLPSFLICNDAGWQTTQWDIDKKRYKAFECRLPVTRTLYNLNLPLTRSTFHFPSDNFLYNFTIDLTRTPDNSNLFLFPLKVRIIESRLVCNLSTSVLSYPSLQSREGSPVKFNVAVTQLDCKQSLIFLCKVTVRET